MCLDDPELLNDFVVESIEHLADVESQLLTLEGACGEIDIPLVNKVFRSVHSIKGAAGFLGLQIVETLAHRGEEVLDSLRNQDMKPTSDVINTLLKAMDRLKMLLESIDTSNEQDVSEHVAALQSLMMAAVSPPADAFAEGEVEASDEALAEVVGEEAETQLSDGSQADAVQASLAAAGISQEALREFLIESFDNLEQLERDLVSLERDPADKQLLNSIFRNVHTIKGTAGFLAFHKIEKLTHAGENLLGSLRSGQIEIDNEIAAQLFTMVDCVRRYVTAIETTGSEGNESCEGQVEQLNQTLKSRFGGSAKVTTKPIAAAAASTKPVAKVAPAVPTKQVTPAAIPKFVAPAAAQVATAGAASGTSSVATASAPNSAAAAAKAVTGGEAKPGGTTAAGEPSSHSAADSTIRVDVALLDKLMTRVGELVLARNQILQFTNVFGDSDLLSASQRLNLITTELQEGVMKTRMQPIGNVWAKFPRMVRDLAAICGKEVRIEMEGKETELDKTIIEAIKDPLTHLVRNTVDHGIEKPTVRVENNKPMEGCLYLRAFHEGGQVNIEISDDGAGLNLQRIKEKAIEKGLITQENASRLGEREIAQLIFLPGFSTAETVSNVSGRGVGMDVVKTNIEKIGGTVDLQTVAGRGTTFKIKIPLTLAIIPALVVSCANNRFAIPQVSLLELVRLEGEQATSSIEWIQGAPVYRLRGRLLPLVYLSKILKTPATEAGANGVINIVVLRADDRQFGLVVDRINDTEEIVVKPLSKQLKGVSVYSGATIMGDGKVALILDVMGIAHSADVVSKDRKRSSLESSSRAKEGVANTQTLLVLGTGCKRRLALPISQVARLETIEMSSIEYADDREVVQYRGEILPLLRLASILGLEDDFEPTDGLLNIVVYSEHGVSYGLVVNRIVDIVEAGFEISRPSRRVGLLGSTVIHEHVTDVVDLPSIIRQLDVPAEPVFESCT
jgi:two-component system, chemotaxis family, sensor kinase CheA